MAPQINYEQFINDLDKRLSLYFSAYQSEIACERGCSACCEKGDYPVSDIELEYLIKGYSELENDIKIQIQNNIKNIEKGGQCPFLLHKECSVYKYRPIICRVHGLPYLCNDNVVKVPYCANYGKCYKKSYSDGQFVGNPVKENLDTYALLKGYDCEIRNLYDWINKT